MACHHPITSHCFTKYVFNSGVVVHKSGPIQTCLEEELSCCFTYTASILHTDFKRYQRNSDCLPHHISTYVHSQAGWFAQFIPFIQFILVGSCCRSTNFEIEISESQILRSATRRQNASLGSWKPAQDMNHLRQRRNAKDIEGSSRKILRQAAEEPG